MLLNNTPINVGMNFGVRCGAQAGARCRHEHNMVTHAQRSDTVCKSERTVRASV